MPQKDKEEYNKYQREHRQRTRGEEKVSVLLPPGKMKAAAKAAKTQAPPTAALEAAKTPRAARNAEKFTAELLGDMGKLTRSAWVARRAQLAAEMMQVGIEAIRSQHGTLTPAPKKPSFIKTSDALRMLKNGVAMMDQVVHTLAPTAEEEGPDRDAMAAAHKKVLSTPEGRAASQQLMLMRAEAFREIRGEAAKK